MKIKKNKLLKITKVLFVPITSVAAVMPLVLLTSCVDVNNDPEYVGNGAVTPNYSIKSADYTIVTPVSFSDGTGDTEVQKANSSPTLSKNASKEMYDFFMKDTTGEQSNLQADFYYGIGRFWQATDEYYNSEWEIDMDIKFTNVIFEDGHPKITRNESTGEMYVDVEVVYHYEKDKEDVVRDAPQDEPEGDKQNLRSHTTRVEITPYFASYKTLEESYKEACLSDFEDGIRLLSYMKQQLDGLGLKNTGNQPILCYRIPSFTYDLTADKITPSGRYYYIPSYTYNKVLSETTI